MRIGDLAKRTGLSAHTIRYCERIGSLPRASQGLSRQREYDASILPWIDLAPWDHIPAGYIQTSALFDRAADDAQRRGWPVERLRGTHLDPTLRPEETAAAIAAVSRALG